MVSQHSVQAVLLLVTVALGMLSTGCGGTQGGDDAGTVQDASADQASADGSTDASQDAQTDAENDQATADQGDVDLGGADGGSGDQGDEDQGGSDVGISDEGVLDLGDSSDSGVLVLLDTPLSAAEDQAQASALDFAGPEDMAAACTFAVTTLPAHGTVTLGAPLQFTYSPAANYHGSDSAVITATCGSRSTSATVSITVHSINDAPLLRLVGNESVTPPLSRPFSSDVTETVCLSLEQGIGSVDLGFEFIDVEPAPIGEDHAYVAQVTPPESPLCLVHFPTSLAWAVSSEGYTFVGTLAAVQLELSGLFVECGSAAPVSTSVAVSVSDMGHTGACSPTDAMSCPKTASAVVHVQARATSGNVNPYAGACPQ